MATSKTLKPTNQTINIPELSDAPNIAVPADAISKEADAINALSDRTGGYSFTTEYSSVLDMVIDQVVTKKRTLPFSFMKAGSSSLSDVPSSVGTAEFSGIVTGCTPRLEVEISQYGSDNDFRREIFNGAWRTNSWYSTNDKFKNSTNSYAIGCNFASHNVKFTYTDDNEYNNFIIGFAGGASIFCSIGWDTSQTSISPTNLFGSAGISVTKSKSGSTVTLIFSRSNGNGNFVLTSLSPLYNRNPTITTVSK